MSEIMMQKAGHGTLAPMDEEGAEFMKGLKPGRPVRVEITKPRNPKFHAKFFALLNTGFEYWEPAPFSVINERGFRGARKFARYISDQVPSLHPQIKNLMSGFSKQYSAITVEPEKNSEQFRSDVIILAGYYETHHRLDGSFQVVAKSISFANMSETEFQQLYKAVYEVIWKQVMSTIEGWTQADMDRAIEGMMSYG